MTDLYMAAALAVMVLCMLGLAEWSACVIREGGEKR